MKKAIITMGAAILILGLTGCNSSREGFDDGGFRSENIATPDGSVTCVLYDGYDGDAISCNWKNAG